MMMFVFQKDKKHLEIMLHHMKQRQSIKKSLDDSLDLSKKSIYSLFDGLLREKKCFKYNLTTVVTLKKTN